MGPLLIEASCDPEATTVISLACVSPHKAVRLCTLSTDGVTPDMLVSFPCDLLHDIVIKRTRCGSKQGGPFPIVPVLQNRTTLETLFYHTNGCAVVDLALVFKTNASWRNAKLVSLQALSDTQLSTIFENYWLRPSCAISSVVHPSSAERIASPVIASTLPPDFLRLLVSASQLSSITAILRAPDTSQRAPLNFISRRGVKVEHLSAQCPPGFTLCRILFETGDALSGIYPVIPIDEISDAKSQGFFHATGFAHGAAVALKPFEAQWNDGPSVWVDVRRLLPAHLAELRQAAEQLLDAEVVSDDGDDGDLGCFFATAAVTPTPASRKPEFMTASITTPTCFPNAGPLRLETSSLTLPLAPSSMKYAPLKHDVIAPSTILCSAHSPSAMDTFLRDLCLRAHDLGVVPADTSASANFLQLLQEAVQFGANHEASMMHTTCHR
jgi:hypothetical protein